jgi:hypothetical protein
MAAGGNPMPGASATDTIVPPELSVGSMFSTPSGARALAPTAVISSFPQAASGNDPRAPLSLSQGRTLPAVAAGPNVATSTTFSVSPSTGTPSWIVNSPIGEGAPLNDVAHAAIKGGITPLPSEAGAKSGAIQHDDIPHMPKPNPRPFSDGTDEWGAARNTRNSDDDDNYRDKQGLVRKGRFFGYRHAADFLGHFLDNSGTDMHVDPRIMLKEIPDFSDRNDEDYRRSVLAVASQAIRQNYRGQAIKIVIPGRWNAASAKGGDWYYTLHQFDFVNAAVVHVVPAANGKVDISIDAKLYVYDKYNWDPNKQARVGYFGIDDEEMARLHQVGLAREYEVKGEMRYPRHIWRGVDPARMALPLP